MSVKFKNNVEVDGIISVESLKLNTTPLQIPTTQGSIYFDEDDLAIAAVLNGYVQKIGEDSFYPVKNQTGTSIAKGTAVRFAGTVGASGRLLIAPFIANGTVPSSQFMGVTVETIADGADGKVLWFGRVRGINTDAFNEGDILYASTTVAGGFQTAIPVAPNNIVEVAAVVTKSITVGTLFVRPQLGSNINSDEGVKIVSIADKNLLQYQSGSGLWENKTLAQAGVQPTLTNPVTGTGTTNFLSKFTGTSTLGNSLVFDNGTNVGIGTTNPVSKLTVTTGTDTTFNDGALKVIGNIALNSAGNLNPSLNRWSLRARPSNIEGAFDIFDARFALSRLLIDSAGSVGIGTTNPGATFHVNGTGLFTDNTSINAEGKYFQTAGPFPWGGTQTIGVRMGTDNVTGLIDFRRWLGSGTLHHVAAVRQIQGADSAFGLSFNTDNLSASGLATTSRMYIHPTSGNVGINKTNPGEKLDVNGNLIVSGNFNSLYVGGKTDSNIDGIRILCAGDDSFVDCRGGSGLNFRLNDTDGSTQRIKFHSGGNVSIGNTNNTHRLDVTGTVNATSFNVQALNTAPATATSTGTVGEIRYTTDYIYVCVATNTWKRVLLSTW